MAKKMTDQERALALRSAGLNTDAIAAILGTDREEVVALYGGAASAGGGYSDHLTDASSHPLPSTDGPVPHPNASLDFRTDSGFCFVYFSALIHQPDGTLDLAIDGESILASTETGFDDDFHYYLQPNGNGEAVLFSVDGPMPSMAMVPFVAALEPGDHTLAYLYDSPGGGGTISDIHMVVLPL